jgi:MFS family permease
MWISERRWKVVRSDISCVLHVEATGDVSIQKTATVKNIGDWQLFKAFRSLNFTLYFAGRAISQFGTWMQRTAVVWVVYTISHSSFLLGVAVFAETFPSFLFFIIGGVVADRYNRYKIIRVTQIASMLQAVLLAVLVLTGHTVIWAILMLSVILGVINAFDVPARQALIHEVVKDPADLPNALSLTTAMTSLATLLGPALAGIVLDAWGTAACFLLNAASFGGVIVSLLLMKLPPYVPQKSGKKVMTEFVEGVTYLRKTPAIGGMIFLLALVGLLVLPYNTMLPVFAKVVFKGNAATFGYMNSFVGIGAVIGTIFLASRKPGTPYRRILLAGTIVMGVGLICFSQLKDFPLALIFVAFAGFGSFAQFTICNIVVQSESAPEMRGRVIGILMMAVFGMSPLGSLMVGALSQQLGAPVTVLGEGIAALVLAFVFRKFLTKQNYNAGSKDRDNFEG